MCVQSCQRHCGDKWQMGKRNSLSSWRISDVWRQVQSKSVSTNENCTCNVSLTGLTEVVIFIIIIKYIYIARNRVMQLMRWNIWFDDVTYAIQVITTLSTNMKQLSVGSWLSLMIFNGFWEERWTYWRYFDTTQKGNPIFLIPEVGGRCSLPPEICT